MTLLLAAIIACGSPAADNVDFSRPCPEERLLLPCACGEVMFWHASSGRPTPFTIKRSRFWQSTGTIAPFSTRIVGETNSLSWLFRNDTRATRPGRWYRYRVFDADGDLVGETKYFGISDGRRTCVDSDTWEIVPCPVEAP